MSLISPAAEAIEKPPLEAPAGFSFDGRQRRQGIGRGLVLPLLALPLLILVAKYLFSKSR
jgi:hypothetical protein